MFISMFYSECEEKLVIVGVKMFLLIFLKDIKVF